jgi:probable F420-dependent oxidoreductase
MKIGLPLAMMRPSLWSEVTVAADELGIESVWMPEHLVIPVAASGSPNHGQEHPPIPANVAVYDVFTHLAFLAAQTTQIHFGTYVYNIGLRHPFSTARAVTTLDILSEGRVELGIGASWLKEEWDAVGLDFSTRGRRVDEAIEVCLALWSDEVIEHHGEFFDFDEVMFEPKPVHQPHPPIHVGGDGPAALRRAATIGQGWIPMNHAPEQLPEPIAKIAQLRHEAGIEGNVEITLGGGEPTLETFEKLAALGVHRAIVRPWSSTREWRQGLEAFAANVLPDVQALETSEPLL